MHWTSSRVERETFWLLQMWHPEVWIFPLSTVSSTMIFLPMERIIFIVSVVLHVLERVVVLLISLLSIVVADGLWFDRYDVENYQRIEALINKKLEAFPCDEKLVCYWREGTRGIGDGVAGTCCWGSENGFYGVEGGMCLKFVWHLIVRLEVWQEEIWRRWRCCSSNGFDS